MKAFFNESESQGNSLNSSLVCRPRKRRNLRESLSYAFDSEQCSMDWFLHGSKDYTTSEKGEKTVTFAKVPNKGIPYFTVNWFNLVLILMYCIHPRIVHMKGKRIDKKRDRRVYEVAQILWGNATDLWEHRNFLCIIELLHRVHWCLDCTLHIACVYCDIISWSSLKCCISLKSQQPLLSLCKSTNNSKWLN